MFIVWGTKLVRKKDGFVGHCCAICRTIHLFRVIDLWRVKHLYYLPLGSGEHAATELVCEKCGMMIGLKQFSGGPVPSPDADLIEFASWTSPLGRAGLLARVDLEERARSGNVSQAERQQLLAEPFLALEYFAQVERVRGSDRSSGAVIGLLTIVGAFASAAMWGVGANTFWTIVVTLTSAALLSSLISRLIQGRTRLPKSRKILKQLAEALRPLDPSAAEIEQTLALFRKKQTLLGVGLEAASINSAIKENFAR
jgi:hypothetical protein